MPKSLILTNLVMRDFVELYRARVNIHQTYAAIEQTSLQAKAALLGSLDQADDVLVEIFRKGAKRAVRFGAFGEFKRTRVPQPLIELLAELAPLPEPEPEPEPELRTSGRKQRGSAAVNGGDGE